MLELQTSKSGENNISVATYNKIVKQINEIRGLCDKKRARGQNQPDPVLQLVEIETYVNKIIKFMALAKSADRNGHPPTTHVRKILTPLIQLKKEENFKERTAADDRRKEMEAKRVQDRKN